MEKQLRSILLSAIFIVLLVSNISAQPARTLVQVRVAPQNIDWVYKPNEKVKFDVVVSKNNIPLRDVTIRYEYGPEMMPVTKSETIVLKNGTATIDGGTMKEPGF